MWNFPLFPDAASSVSSSVDGLLGITIAITIFFSVLIAGLILFFATKYRYNREADRSNPPTFHLRLEIAWTLIPLAIVLALFVAGTKVFIDQTHPPKDAVSVYVVGKQWMWKIQHPEGQREINELHVPRGRAIKLILASQDVLHSFFIPAFRVKQDVVPGHVFSLWFEATKTGRYHLFCSQYCGTLHSEMIGTVTVMEPADYEKWLTGRVSESMSDSGAKLFDRLGCATCHRGDAQARAPNLVGLFGKPVALKGGQTVTADEKYIRESILNPEAKIVYGYEPIMPTFKGQVDEEGILKLIAYIRSLGDQGPAKGAAVGSSVQGRK